MENTREMNKTVTFRIDEVLLKKLDSIVHLFGQNLTGKTCRADVIRLSIIRGIKQIEEELKPQQKQEVK